MHATTISKQILDIHTIIRQLGLDQTAAQAFIAGEEGGEEQPAYDLSWFLPGAMHDTSISAPNTTR